MSRILSAEMQAVATAEVVRPIYLIDMAFSASTVRLWSGLGDLDTPVGEPINLNPSFASNLNNWSTQELGTGTVTYTSGQANMSGPDYPNRAGVFQSSTTVAGEKYTVTVNHTGADVEVRLGDMYVGPDNYFYYQRISAGTFQYTFTALGSTTQIMVRSRYGGTAVVTNVNLNKAETYVGAGDLLKISEIQETADLQANGANVTLSGCNATLINLAQNEDYQGRLMTISLGAFDGSGNVIASPAVLFTGFMDVMTISDGGQFSSINVSVENKLIAFERAYVRRYTDNDQKIEHPTDDGFEYVTSIQELEIIWGRNTPAAQPTAGIAGREGLRTGRGNRG
tara:strand:- start:11955 stop:12971 length:1017 start_codon:yes stop_codon:yes gene_type:complete